MTSVQRRRGNDHAADRADDHGAALRELILAGENYRVAAADYLGVSITDSQVVSYLMARGEMGQTELAEAMAMTTGSMTTVIDRLVERGIVERRPHATDRRRSIVSLSDRGDRDLEEVRSWLADAFALIEPARRGALAADLRRLSEHLRTRTDEIPAREPETGRPRRRR